MPVHDLADTRAISEAGLRAIPILVLGPMFEFGATFKNPDLDYSQRVRVETIEGLARRGIVRFEQANSPWQDWNCRKAIITPRGRVVALALEREEEGDRSR